MSTQPHIQKGRRMSMKDTIEYVASNPKVATGVAAGTVGSGLAHIIDYIPDNIGKLAAFVGVVLSIVLIYQHMRRAYSQRQIEALEIEKLTRENELLRDKKEKLEAIARRKKKNLTPSRRFDDDTN